MISPSFPFKIFNTMLSPPEKIILLQEIFERYGRESVVFYPGLREMGGSISDLPKEVVALRKRSKFLLLGVGALHPQKRPLVSLEALLKLRKEIPSVGLLFVDLPL